MESSKARYLQLICAAVFLIGFLTALHSCSRSGGKRGNGIDWSSEEWINWEKEYVRGACEIKVRAGMSRKDVEQLVREYSRYNLAIESSYEEEYPGVPEAVGEYGLSFNPYIPVPIVVEELRKDPRIEIVNPASWIVALQTFEPVYPNDPYMWGQWGLQQMQVYEAWAIEKGKPEIIVAIVDTGIDLLHPDLAENLWKNSDEIAGDDWDNDNNGFVDDVLGWDFVNNDSIPQDDSYRSHGTLVAGIVGAVVDNNQGIAGISWYSKLMAVKVLNRDGYGEPKDVAKGIRYAAKNGANVINLSLGDYQYHIEIARAIGYAIDKGCIVVAAMGNDNVREKMYPAALSRVIAVGSTQLIYGKETKSDYSNWGWWMDVVAPGQRVFTTRIGDYTWESDTSLATPQVSGVIALMLSRNPYLRRKTITSILKNAADDVIWSESLDSYTLDHTFKRINAYRALLAVTLLPTPEESIHAGLSWLRTVQNPDGSWAYADGKGVPCVGITALAVLAFLNAGVSPDDPAVSKGLGYLMKNVNPDGSINGAVERISTKVYETSCAIWALVAAKISSGRDDWDDAIEGAREYLLGVQYLIHDDKKQFGGWGYPVEAWADLSNTQFAALALHVTSWADLSLGFTSSSRDNLEIYLRANQKGDGGFPYRQASPAWTDGGIPYGSMTAAGMWCAFLIEVQKSDPMIQGAMNWFNSRYTYTNNPGITPGWWYYYYIWTASKAFEMYEFNPRGRDWYHDFYYYLVLDEASPYRQQANGSWPAAGGEPKVFSTILAILTLQIRQTIFQGELRFILGTRARLHIYDPRGRHAGYNPATGHVELQIPHAEYIPLPEGGQEIRIHKHFDPGVYRIIVEGIESTPYSLSVEGYYNGHLVSSQIYKGMILPGERQQWRANVATIITPVTMDVNFPPNKPPVAIAGGPYRARTKDVLVDVDPDTLNRDSRGRWVTAYLTVDPNGQADLRLDGSGSYDPEGDLLTYRWEIYNDAGNLVARLQGIRPSISLQAGRYRVKLVVNDGKIDSDPAATEIEVELLNLGLLVDEKDRLLKEIRIFLNGVARDWGELQGASLMVKFPRQDVIEVVYPGREVEIRITGDLRGRDLIRVIRSSGLFSKR